MENYLFKRKRHLYLIFQNLKHLKYIKLRKTCTLHRTLHTQYTKANYIYVDGTFILLKLQRYK